MKKTIKFVLAAALLASTATVALADGAKIFVVGGKADDPFWSIVKRGAEDAGKVVSAEGGKVVWLAPQNYDNLGVDAAELIRQAIDQKADAIVAPDWAPAAMDPAFQAVKAAGIPFIVYNAGGIQAADRLGAMNYVGAVNYLGGVAGGDYLAKAGHTRPATRAASASIRCRARPTSKIIAKALATASRKPAANPTCCRCRRPRKAT